MINKQNLETSIAEIEVQLAEMKNHLNSINSKAWQPKLNETYFWVNVLGNVIESTVDSREGLRHRIFKTQQEAKEYAKYVKAEEILKQKIASLNEGWTPDWKNKNETKYSFSYSIRGEYISIEGNDTLKLHDSFIYLKSRKLAEDLINTHSKELITYLSY